MNVMEANSGRLMVQRIRVSTCIVGVIPMWFCFQEASRVDKYFSDFLKIAGSSRGQR